MSQETGRSAAEKSGIDKNSLSGDVYRMLLLKLMNNELVPGDILNRRTLADEFGVSVAPVLEALLQLKIEGFVESIPRKGTLVKAIRREDVFDQLMLREAIECQASRIYCGEPVRKQAQRLAALAGQLDSTAVNTPEHWKQEIEFHTTLVSLSGSRALEREFLRIAKLSIFYDINRVVISPEREQNESHLRLIADLETEDPDAAERVVRRHLRSGKQTLFPSPA